MDGKSWFLIDNLLCRLISNKNEEIEEKTFILFPKYLVDLEGSLGINIYLDNNMECSKDISIREICNFYKGSGYYKTEIINENELHLKFNNNGLPDEIVEQHQHDGTIVIKILRRDDKVYLNVSRSR